MAETLGRIYADYRNDRAFVNLAKRSRFVPGAGSGVPAFIIVGEAPGAKENELGLPFVGKSGEVLDKLLWYNNINGRDEVFITNVIKYQPPGNRTPTTAEVNAARPYLSRELVAVGKHRPLVLLLGNTAQSLLGDQAPKRGRVKKRGSWHFAALYHPAVALYDPSKMDVLRTQFREVIKEYNKQTLPRR